MNGKFVYDWKSPFPVVCVYGFMNMKKENKTKETITLHDVLVFCLLFCISDFLSLIFCSLSSTTSIVCDCDGAKAPQSNRKFV